MVRVAQCWDDGVCNDIRLAEMLRKYNVKATFNLNPGLHAEERQEAVWTAPGYTGWSHKGYLPGKLALAELSRVYAGFEVASHCWRHEVPAGISTGVFVKSALDARHFLEDMFQKPCLGFAWPCGQFTPETADALRGAGFAYGRTTRKTDDVGAYQHPMILDASCHFQDNEFYRIFAAAKAKNGIFYFWGHSYEMLDSEGMWSQFEDKIKFLCDAPEVVWCDVIDLVK